MNISTLAIYILEGIANKIRFFSFKRSIDSGLRELRKKDKIRCVFVVHDLAMWKTEALFQKMLEHFRFEPILCIALTTHLSSDLAVKKFETLKNYVEKRNYPYCTSAYINTLNPDITLYVQPYENIISENLWFRQNKGLKIFLSYGFNGLATKSYYNLPLINYSSMVFVENNLSKQIISGFFKHKGRTIRVTGFPISDLLFQDKEKFGNPWKKQNGAKKKIIWAPHFSVEGASFLRLSSFLEMYEFMTEFARKYEDKIQIAFKPHPNLYPTLIDRWGEEKTNSYYELWRDMPNTQIEEGEYMGLFQYSDAMIHDCGSFLIEYLHINKPELYTIPGDESLAQFNEFSLKAYDCCSHGNSREVVERFICDVIDGKDVLLGKRNAFINEYLIPPNSKTACENIIDAILGLNGYK